MRISDLCSDVCSSDLENLDQVVGVRRGSAYRAGHEAGNKALNRIVTGIFGDSMGDMLSGYRVFSRRFVKSFPAVSREFEIETELTVHSSSEERRGRKE